MSENRPPPASSERLWDAIIVGQGLAGSVLAWHLTEAGQSVLLLDPQEETTASRIAAGLMTPITGKRLALSWRCDEIFLIARTFYRRIEKCTGQSFFRDRMALRLFQNEAERREWARRCREPAFRAHLADSAPAPLLDPELGDMPHGGFAMQAAQLDPPAFLRASRSAMPVAPVKLDWRRDVIIGDACVAAAGYRGRRLISCEGFGAVGNPYFDFIPFDAAKGDILTVRFDRPLPPRTIHRGIWIAPTTDASIFRVGATYRRDRLDTLPSASGRGEIERRLREFFHVPYEVLDHCAAVRPIIAHCKALAGLHPTEPRLGFLNGLGSKGTMLAPWLSERFTELLLHGRPLPEEVDLRKRFANHAACN